MSEHEDPIDWEALFWAAVIIGIFLVLNPMNFIWLIVGGAMALGWAIAYIGWIALILGGSIFLIVLLLGGIPAAVGKVSEYFDSNDPKKKDNEL